MTSIGLWALMMLPAQITHPLHYQYEVVAEYPHDESAFTQGLVLQDGKLYESTGQYGQSELREVDLATGAVLRNRPLPKNYFGEGIEYLDGKLFQLTWQEKTAIVYRASDFQPLGQFRYSGEGWGITEVDGDLIVSDGTSTLRRYDANTFRLKSRLKVMQSGRELNHLNELEMVGGVLYANVWHSNYIAMIDLQTGQVVGIVDLTRLNPINGIFQREKVLNGTAYDEKTGHLLVTGKNWPKLYEIKLTAPSN